MKSFPTDEKGTWKNSCHVLTSSKYLHVGQSGSSFGRKPNEATICFPRSALMVSLPPQPALPPSPWLWLLWVHLKLIVSLHIYYCLFPFTFSFPHFSKPSHVQLCCVSLSCLFKLAFCLVSVLPSACGCSPSIHHSIRWYNTFSKSLSFTIYEVEIH